MVYSFIGVKKPLSSTKWISAGEHELLFAQMNGQVRPFTKILRTDAIICTSLFLDCRKLKLTSALHMSIAYLKDPNLVNMMLQYDLATFKRLAGEHPISAYISGCGIDFGGKSMIENNRWLISSILNQLLIRNIRVEEIDIGGVYDDQAFNVETGKFTVTRRWWLDSLPYFQSLNFHTFQYLKQLKK